MIATGGMKAEEAGKLRRLADRIERDHPETVVHGHLRDAARSLDRGDVKAASRHLAVARHTLTPQQLFRHGITRGIDHSTARLNAGEVDRRMLALRDIHDIENDNTSQYHARRAEQAAEAERKAQARPVTGSQPMRPGESSSPLHQVGGQPTAGQQAGTQLAAWHHAMTAVELGFNPFERRDKTGKWTSQGAAAKIVSDMQKIHKGELSLSGSRAWGEGVESGVQKLRNGDVEGGRRDLLAGKVAADAQAAEASLTGMDSTASAAAAESRMLTRHIKAINAVTGTHTTLSNVYAMSAQTARLAATPAPRGRPGGPGLYDVKGMGHTAYLQQIVKALIEKRGMPEGKAYAIARAAIRKWARGGGKVHPEVRAAAGAAESGELARQARAKSMSGDARNVREIWALAWQLANVVELAGPQPYTRHPDETVQCPVCHRWDAPDARFCDQCGNSLLLSKPGYKPREYDAQGEGKGEPVTCPNCGQGDAADARFCDQCGHQLRLSGAALANYARAVELFNPAGNPAQARVPPGQAGAGQFTAGGGGQQSQQKQKPGQKKPATAAERAKAKAQLEQKIKGERAKLSGLRKQLAGLLAAQKHSAKSRAQATKAGQPGKSAASTPAKKQQATKTAAQPGAGKAAASSAANAAAKASKPGAHKLTAVQQIASLHAQISALTKTIATQSAQAAKL
jgi:hypothetical protein